MGTGSFPGVKCGRGLLLTNQPLLLQVLPTKGKDHGRSKSDEKNKFILFLLVYFDSLDASEFISRHLPKFASLSLASFHSRLSRIEDHHSLLHYVKFTIQDKFLVSGRAMLYFNLRAIPG
jgi:hypothetical protein